MDRPTRKYQDLLRKIEDKKARSRDTGKKLKRMRHWEKSYAPLVEKKKQEREGG